MIYVVAEIGCNHNGDMHLAGQLVEEAARCGVDAVKFQTFKAENLVSRFAPKAEYQVAATDSSESQLEMVKGLEMSPDDYLAMKELGESLGLDVFSTPFDDEALEFLVSTGMSTIKIASGELTNLPFLQKIGSLKKKVILSTGMSVMDEVESAVGILEEAGTTDITILHATTQYPTLDSDLNLNAITSLRQRFPSHDVGYSDHSVGYSAATVAAALGATVIEKHFTLSHDLPGPDHKASATPDVMRQVVQGVRFVEVALGAFEKKPVPVEKRNMVAARKSIVARRSIRKGEVFTEENLAAKRPGNGISPMRWYDVLGHVAEQDFCQDELIVSANFEPQGR